jgi:hypothetical protein
VLLGKQDTLQIMFTCKKFQNLTFKSGDHCLDDYILSNDPNVFRNCACETYKCLVENGYISVDNIIAQYHGTAGQYICEYVQSHKSALTNL